MDIRETIRRTLRAINLPDQEIPVSEVIIDVNLDDNGKAVIDVNFTPPDKESQLHAEKEIATAALAVEGVKTVQVNFISDTPENYLSDTYVIAIGSGKGGVGKSTVTVGLAFALRDMGYSVGILDADIYGFSVPRLTGVLGKTPNLKNETIVVPVEKDGVKIISMGSLVDENQALAWRGPMLQGILEQFVNNVEWGKLDYLLVDLPPGTGDVTISLINLLPGASFIIVTTPQVTSYQVATRLGMLAKQVHMQTLGIIENMAYFECDKCGEKHYIFGQSGGDLSAIARDLRTRVLGHIPMRKSMREAADNGRMSEVSKSDDAREFREIAAKIPELAQKAKEKRMQEPRQPLKSACSLEAGG